LSAAAKSETRLHEYRRVDLPSVRLKPLTAMLQQGSPSRNSASCGKNCRPP
jgi:hypothetical protein